MANKHVIMEGHFSFKKEVQNGYKQSLDNGVINKPGSSRLGDFADILAEGENPAGLMVQTANGTSREDHRQVRTVYNGDTNRWMGNEDWDGDLTGN